MKNYIFFLSLVIFALFLGVACSPSAKNDQDAKGKTSEQDNNGKAAEDENAPEQRLLKETELEGKSKKELRLMRNEIFARYGRIFKSKDLTQHFSAQSWYSPQHKDVEKMLTEIDRKNVALIQSFEQKTSEEEPMDGDTSDEDTNHFDDFLEGFSPRPFPIEVAYEMQGGTPVPVELTKEFIAPKIVYQKELDCYSARYSAFYRLDVSDATLAVLVQEEICPMPAAYSEVLLITYNKATGDEVQRRNICYIRGGGDGDHQTQTASIGSDLSIKEVGRETLVKETEHGLEDGGYIVTETTVKINSDGTIQQVSSKVVEDTTKPEEQTPPKKKKKGKSSGQ